MVHRLNRMLVAFAVIAVGVAVAGTIATAQTCIVVNGVKVYVLPNTYNTSGATGTAVFSTPTQIPPAPNRLNQSLTPQNINVSSTEPTLGTITTTLDPVRASSPTTIVSNGTARFPATGTIKFYGRATISSKPGITYGSQTELVFVNNNLSQILPFNATFSLQSDVTFRDPATGDSFLLKAGSTTVTL